MGYNGSIIVLVFSTSIFMTWGTTVLSLYLYFPHQSLWHGIQWFYHCTCIFHIKLYDMGYNCSIIVLVFSTSIFMTWGTTVLSLYLYFPHKSLWHGVQRFYHCTCIFHINLYDMGYSGYIIVLVFSTSIFITWGTTVLIFMTWGTTVLIFITWGTTVLSLYFPHQSLWHGVKVLISMTWGSTVLIFMTWGTTVLSLNLYFPHHMTI